MKTYKFRVWDGKEMIYFPHKTKDLVFTDKGPNIISFHRGVQLPMIERKDLKVMNYIELKDKNDKEIYEGDILKWEGLNCYNITEVEFSSGAFYPFNSDWLDSCLSVCEITGNIYENSK